MLRHDVAALAAVAALILLDPSSVGAQRTRQDCKDFGGSTWVPNANGRGGHYVWRSDIRCKTIVEAAPAHEERRTAIERPASPSRSLTPEEVKARDVTRAASEKAKVDAERAAVRARGDAERSAGRAAPLLADTPESSREEVQRRMASLQHLLGTQFRDVGLFTTHPRRAVTTDEMRARPTYAPDTVRETKFRIAVALERAPTSSPSNVRFVWSYRTVLGEGASSRGYDPNGNTDAWLSFRAVRCTPGSDTVGVAEPYGEVGTTGRVVRVRTARDQVYGLTFHPVRRSNAAFAKFYPEEYAIASVACNDNASASLPVVTTAALAATPMPAIFDSVVTMPTTLPSSDSLMPVRVRGQSMNRRIGLARTDTLLDGSQLFWVIVHHDSVVTPAAVSSCEPYRTTDCARPYDAELRLERHRCSPSGFGDYGWGDSWFRPRLAARYLKGIRVAEAPPAPRYADPATGAGALLPTSAPRATRSLERRAGDYAEEGFGARAEICAAVASPAPPQFAPIVLRAAAARATPSTPAPSPALPRASRPVRRPSR